MTKRMRDIVSNAKKRRASLLKQFLKKSNWTITEFAELHKLTRARMSKLLIQARNEKL